MEQYDPKDLLIFARVAEAGSFSRAAEWIGLPKSTVSRRITLLEEKLGERLILRTTRRLVLTEFGNQLLEYAQQIAVEVDAVKALSEHRQLRPGGRLRVSMPSDFATLLLTDMLTAFTVACPEVLLELDLSPRHVDLLEEKFDLAIRIGELPDDTLLVARRLHVFPVSLYAAPAYLEKHGEPQTPEDLAQHRLLRLLGNHGKAIAWTLLCGKQRHECTTPGRIVANSPELLIHQARAGAGITAVPDYFALPGVRRGELHRVLPEWHLPPNPACAVFPGRRLMPAKTRVFIDMLQAALNKTPGNA